MSESTTIERIKDTYKKLDIETTKFGIPVEKHTLVRIVEALIRCDYQEAEKIIVSTRSNLWQDVLDTKYKIMRESTSEIPLLTTYSNSIRERIGEITRKYTNILSELENRNLTIVNQCYDLVEQIDSVIMKAEIERKTVAQNTVRSIFWRGLPIALASIIVMFWFTGPDFFVVIIPISFWLIVLPIAYYSVRKYPTVSKKKVSIISYSMLVLAMSILLSLATWKS